MTDSYFRPRCICKIGECLGNRCQFCGAFGDPCRAMKIGEMVLEGVQMAGLTIYVDLAQRHAWYRARNDIHIFHEEFTGLVYPPPACAG